MQPRFFYVSPIGDAAQKNKGREKKMGEEKKGGKEGETGTSGGEDSPVSHQPSASGLPKAPPINKELDKVWKAAEVAAAGRPPHQ